MKYLWMVLLAALMLFGCSETNDEADWTILVYMAADNGLNDSALSDINELENAEFSSSIKIAVQIDNSDFNNPSTAFRYEVIPDDSNEITSPRIESLGEIDSGDPNSISDFANWGFYKYPSIHKALVIWSHGNGWYNLASQFCPDDESGTSISLPEGDLKQALSQINYPVDILILDACNMQTIEVLTEAAPFADFVIASEEAVCADGFPYDDIINSWKNINSPEAIAASIPDIFVDSYLPGGSQNNSNIYLSVSCSAVMSQKFFTLQQMISDFADKWHELAGESYFREARQQTYQFNDLESDIDFKEFLLILEDIAIPQSLREDVEALLLQMDKTFIATDFIDYPTDGIGTATIWYPTESVIFNNLSEQYQSLDFGQLGWYQFLEATFE